ncbi:hypothetical protein [uncultured Formosa sp.]|uniref:hypothetical protein n=1 Tax=uncultured Formosa sp. TaxID=255435 RepID=UPI002628EB9A|nr:hypothetical protein [uncultured Formosa sp.]
MRKISVVSALILSIVATVWATLPKSIFASIPAIIALVLAIYGLYLSKHKIQPKATAQLAILLSSIALIFSVSKLFITPPPAEEKVPTEQKIEQDISDDENDLENDFEEEEDGPQDSINSNSKQK